jgi:hypothetical protein
MLSWLEVCHSGLLLLHLLGCHPCYVQVNCNFPWSHFSAMSGIRLAGGASGQSKPSERCRRRTGRSATRSEGVAPIWSAGRSTHPLGFGWPIAPSVQSRIYGEYSSSSGSSCRLVSLTPRQLDWILPRIILSDDQRLTSNLEFHQSQAQRGLATLTLLPASARTGSGRSRSAQPGQLVACQLTTPFASADAEAPL